MTKPLSGRVLTAAWFIQRKWSPVEIRTMVASELILYALAVLTDEERADVGMSYN